MDLSELATLVEIHGRIVRILVLETAGSTPREAGASMCVWPDGIHGTIGGGTLEYQTIETARGILKSDDLTPFLRRISLGPGLGQCCGGTLTLLYESYDEEALAIVKSQSKATGFFARSSSSNSPVASEKICSTIENFQPGANISAPILLDGWTIEGLITNQISVWIFGAGHVGRAIVTMLEGNSNINITWIDFDNSRFPTNIGEGISKLVARIPSDAVGFAPDSAYHLVLTHSHDLDLEICNQLLERQFRHVGLIGSKTKWARFRRRLIDLGHDEKKVDCINCPIGEPSFGKNPWSIALGVCLHLNSMSNIQ